MVHDPIAIIGMACRFPGAGNIREFWELLVRSEETIGEVPPDRFDVDALLATGSAIPGHVSSRWGGFIDGIHEFDAAFFGMSPREAARMDPQQRLLLEVAWEALEDAGVTTANISTDTGVFVGQWSNEYESRLFRGRDIDFHMTLGTGRYASPGRLSFFFGFEGPSVSVDTACSSSLVAVHLAKQSLRVRECEIALAGGVNLILDPAITIAYSQSGMMSPEGRCKFGDQAADGYVRSEGVGLVVLKPLSRAIADKDRIYATIRGSAVNSDGRSSGSLGRPSTSGQEAMLRRAYGDAGVLPGCVQYVEAHGTGTRVGDPVELNALGAVLNQGRGDRPKCRVGSVKTNIGHTEGAAGVAGLIKVALALSARMIPASLNHHVPNSSIRWADLPLEIQQQSSPWPIPSETAVAGVSAFGIAGTNAHIVLEQYQPTSEIAISERPGIWRVLTVSSHTPETLEKLAQDYERVLRDDRPNLDDLCYTATVRRRHHAYRRAAVGQTHDELREALRSGRSHQGWPSSRGSRPDTILLFSDSQADWTRFGRELMEDSSAFRAAIKGVDAVIRSARAWSVGEILEMGLPRSGGDQAMSDLIRLSVQLALAEMCRMCGVTAATVAGWGMGAVAAAHHVGTISLADAVLMVCNRQALSTPASPPESRLRVWDTSTPGSQELQDLGATASTSLIEVGPPSTFTRVVRDAGLQSTTLLGASPSEAREVGHAWATVLRGMAFLYELGHAVEWPTLVNGSPTVTTLPPYRWNRQRYWMDPDAKGLGMPSPSEVPEPRTTVRAPTQQPEKTTGPIVNRTRHSRDRAQTELEQRLLTELDDAGY